MAAPLKTSIRGLQRMRTTLDHRLRGCRGLTGTALGKKFVNGKPTNNMCFTVFVEKKLPPSRVSGRERAPKSVSFGQVRLQTDVVSFNPEWVNQGQFDLSKPISVRDRKKLGTLTCFGKSGREVFGVSCAHVLAGLDKDLTTPDPIDAYGEIDREWVQVGESSTLIKYRVENAQDIERFGFLDIGMAALHNRELLTAANSASPMDLFHAREDARSIRRLIGSRVSGQGGRTGRHTAVVRNIWARNVGPAKLNVDVLIEHPEGARMTKRGDSGMLWRLDDGRGLAIHAIGDRPPRRNLGSKFSACMFASRAANALGVEFFGIPQA